MNGFGLYECCCDRDEEMVLMEWKMEIWNRWGSSFPPRNREGRQSRPSDFREGVSEDRNGAGTSKGSVFHKQIGNRIRPRNDEME